VAFVGGRAASVRGRALTPEDRLRRSIIERLMCDLTVDVAERCAAYDTDADHFAAELGKLDELVSDGIVECSGTTITVPEQSRAFVRSVCAVFDAYMSNGEARFSKAS
jgi:oxygen-independent coproporphyrinogen-3 oxidase